MQKPFWRGKELKVAKNFSKMSIFPVGVGSLSPSYLLESPSFSINLLVDCRPQFFISDMIKIMKGNLARQMFLAHPELKQELWGGHLWNPSYCAVTVSD